jgi:hypothetical protein
MRLLLASFFALWASVAVAQEVHDHNNHKANTPDGKDCSIGDFGCNHDAFHNSGFYPRVYRDSDKKGCCNDFDCRPTLLRTNDKGLLQILVDRQWCEIPEDKLAHYVDPSGLNKPHPREVTSIAHVCAHNSSAMGMNPCSAIICVVLPDLN